MGWPSGVTLEAEPKPSLLCPHSTLQPSLAVLPPCLYVGPSRARVANPLCPQVPREHSPSLTSALGRSGGRTPWGWLGLDEACPRTPGMGTRPTCPLLPPTHLCSVIDDQPLE